MNVTFLNPEYLWFFVSVPIIIAIHFLSLNITKKKAITFANFEAIERAGMGVSGGKMFTKNLFLLVLRVSTLIFIILGISGIIYWYNGTGTNFDFVIAIDSSGSMLADDFEPNRLDAAKDSAINFINTIDSFNPNIGVVYFSGITFTALKMTDDIDEIKEAINSIDVEYSHGTAIGDAVIRSTDLFIENNDKAKVIILITDGQSNVGMLTEHAIKYARENNVNIFTIGVATEEGGKVKGLDILSRINEEELQQIADGTGGQYFRATNLNELNSAYTTISTSTEKKIPVNLSVSLILIAICLIFIEWVLINTKFKTLP